MPPLKKKKADPSESKEAREKVQLVECEKCLKWRMVSHDVYQKLLDKSLPTWLCEDRADLNSCDAPLQLGEYPPTIKQPSVKTIEDWFEAASPFLFQFSRSPKFTGAVDDWSHASWFASVDNRSLFEFLHDKGVDVCKDNKGITGFKRLLRYWLDHQVELLSYSRLVVPSS